MDSGCGGTQSVRRKYSSPLEGRCGVTVSLWSDTANALEMSIRFDCV